MGKPLKTDPAKGGATRFYRWAVALLLLWSPVAAFGEEPGSCPDDFREVVAQHFKLDGFASGKGRFIAEACKTWPHDRRLVLSVFGYLAEPSERDAGVDDVDVLVSVFDRDSHSLVSSYRYEITEDAATQVGSFALDTARYRLSNHAFAFGVIFENGANLSKAADPDLLMYHHLTLFVREGENLRPVLKQFMTYEFFCWNNDRSQLESTREEHGILRILPTTTKGWHDLSLVFEPEADEAAGAKRKPVVEILRYDGARYSNDQKDALDSGWQREDL